MAKLDRNVLARCPRPCSPPRVPLGPMRRVVAAPRFAVTCAQKSGLIVGCTSGVIG